MGLILRWSGTPVKGSSWGSCAAGVTPRRAVGAARVIALAAMVSVWAVGENVSWMRDRWSKWGDGSPPNWAAGGTCTSNGDTDNTEVTTNRMNAVAEPVVPIAGDEVSSEDSGSDNVQGVSRVKGEARDRPTHIRLCHLNVTHWGDAVEGMLENPDFDIGLFCEMKLSQEQGHSLRKRLRASGWSGVVHHGVKKSRSELECSEPLGAEGGTACGGHYAWGSTQ